MLSLARFMDLATVLDEWSEACSGHRYAEADCKMVELIRRCCDLIQGVGKDSVSEVEKNGAIVVGVLARGLQGYAEVMKSKEVEEWYLTPKTVERTWGDLWDGIDRLEYARSHLQLPTIEAAYLTLLRVRGEFESFFGTGIYLSPVLVVESFLCSVCGEDYRSCAHIVNRQYDGVLCYRVPTRLVRVESVDFVETPEDPRCRIWPWNRTNDPPGFKDITIMTSFRLDDFLEVPENVDRALRLARAT